MSPERERRAKAPARRHQKRALRLFAIARSDISAALDCARILQDLCEQGGGDRYFPMKSTVFFPVQQGMVISYSRPFVHTRKGPRLQGKKWTTFDDAYLQEAHDQVIAVRHDYVAHSDESLRKVTVIPDGSYVPPGFPSPNKGFGIGTNFIALGAPVIHGLAECCTSLQRRLSREIDDLLEILYAGRSDLPRERFEVVDDDGL